MIVAFLLGCASPTVDTSEPPVVEPAPSIYVPLDTNRLARRVSIDTRAQLPTADELSRAKAGGLDALTEAWMADPAFEGHLADAVAESWLLRLDTLRLDPTEFGLDPTQSYPFTRAFDDEPARLVAHVVAQDRPYTEVVTTDVTMANDLLAEMAPLEFVDPAATGEWREARYTDGRPANGILATTGLWMRYHTTIFNYNRGRAAALARLLLCYDFAGRPVLFENVADQSTQGLQDAITTSPGCIACHATMDPLASTLFGFWPYEDRDGTEMVTYHPERERLSESITGVSPGYFGTPVTAAGQLGLLVADDPRFAVCTARRTAERLWGRKTALDDDPSVYALRDALTESWSYKDLLRATFATEEYRAGSLTDAATDAQRQAAHPLRLMSPTTLRAVVEDVTGFRWTYTGVDLLDSDTLGFRVLLGGADGDTVREPNLEPTVSRSVALRRLAQAAATWVVGHDAAADQVARRLIGTNTPDALAVLTPSHPAFEGALRAIHLRLMAAEPDAEAVAAETDLFSAAEATGGPEGGWTAVVSVLLRDPEFWTY